MAGPSSRSLPWRRNKTIAEPSSEAGQAPVQPRQPPGAVKVDSDEVPPASPATPATPVEVPAAARSSWRDATPLLLLQAVHLPQALLTAVGLTVAAALTGRPGRELGLVLVTVLVGQSVLGWSNDLVDRRRDAAHARSGKPVADGRLEPGTVGFAILCGVLLVVPLSIANGLVAGLSYLIAVAAGLLGTLWPRRNVVSWVPWAVSFGLFPAFLSYGGWGGHYRGDPPSVPITVLAVLLGVGIHVLVSLWGLVADHEDGWSTLPLRLGRRLGTQRLLVVTTAFLVLVVGAMAVVGAVSGLSR